jgi:hypothetical protein
MEPKNTVLESAQISLELKRYYTIQEIATMWRLSPDTIRRLFRDEPGVLILPSRTRGGKRRHTTLRIPQSGLEKVHKLCSLVK